MYLIKQKQKQFSIQKNKIKCYLVMHKLKSKGSSLIIPVFDPEKCEINIMDNK